jgi:hypothetical protein
MAAGIERRRCDEEYVLRLDEAARSIVEHGTTFTQNYS